MDELDKIKKLRAAISKVLAKYGLQLQPGSFVVVPGEAERPDLINFVGKVTLDTFKTADQKEQERYDAELAKIAAQFDGPTIDEKLQKNLAEAEQFLSEDWDED